MGIFFDAYSGVKRWREGVALEFDVGERETRARTGRHRVEVDTKPRRWNAPIQGLTADALKAIAVEAHERQEEIAGLRMAALIRDEVIWMVLEERAEKAARWLTAIMEATADAMVNGDAPPEECVSIKADTSVCGSWADK